MNKVLLIVVMAIVAIPLNAQVTPGITVLVRDSAHLVRGKRVGLITNHTARDERGRSSIDLLNEMAGVRLTALFAPEHGIRGSARGGARIASSVDEKTGIRIHSLYGNTKTPTARMLDDVDVIVYDIQDVGARMYTYVWTMALAAEAAKKAGKKFIVVDRPNPIRDDVVEGGMIEKRYRSFTGLHNVPLRYGMTPGELARFLSSTEAIDADVIVIPMKGYRRTMWWSETGFEWVAPSPNIRDVEAALLYPGMSFFEATNLSEGRGTVEPFRVAGARWLTDVSAIVRVMNTKKLAGVRFESVQRRIGRGEKFGGETIPMIRIVVTNRDRLRSSEIAAHLLREIYVRHPKQFRWQAGAGIEELSGSRALRNAVEKGGIERVVAEWQNDAVRFANQTARFRLY